MGKPSNGLQGPPGKGGIRNNIYLVSAQRGAKWVIFRCISNKACHDSTAISGGGWKKFNVWGSQLEGIQVKISM